MDWRLTGLVPLIIVIRTRMVTEEVSSCNSDVQRIAAILFVYIVLNLLVDLRRVLLNGLLRDLWEVGGAGLASLLLHQLLDVASAEVRHDLIKLCLHRIDVLVVIRFVFVRVRLILLTILLVKLHHLPVFGLI